MLFFKQVTTEIIFMKICKMQKDKSLCRATFFICSTKMLTFIIFYNCSKLQHIISAQ